MSSNKYTASIYEVINSTTHKYSSTMVSGGDVHATSSYATVNPINSTVRMHSDQEIWVRNIESGQERKFDFYSFNIDVREEHKILCVWDNNTDELERIININTGLTSFGNGEANWKGIRSQLHTPTISKGIQQSFFIAIPIFIPNLLYIYYTFMYMKTGNGGKARVKSSKIRLFGFSLFIINFILMFSILSAMAFSTSFASVTLNFFMIFILGLAAMTFFETKILEEEHIYIKNKISEVDNYVREFLAEKSI